MSPQHKQRFELFDILKWLAITAVVVGHYLDYGCSDHQACRGLFLFIYSFHMPLFIFLAGLFDHPRQRYPLNTVVFYLLLSLLMRIICSAIDYMADGWLHFELFGNGGASWYLISMALWISACHLLRSAPLRPVFISGIILGCLIGFAPINGDFMAIFRSVVFFPFYWLGYKLQPKDVVEKLKSPKLRIASIILLLIALLFSLYFANTFYPMRYFFSGRNSFVDTGLSVIALGPGLRLACYFASFSMIALIISAFSQVKAPRLAKLGSRTLSVYFWQTVLLCALFGTGIFDAINQAPYASVLFVVAGIATAFLLSPEFLTRPLNYLRKCIRLEKSGTREAAEKA